MGNYPYVLYSNWRHIALWGDDADGFRKGD